jgi:hypothetical protein
MFFGIEGIAQMLDDPIAAPPLIFWSILLAWWAWDLIKQRRKQHELWQQFMGKWER